MRFADLPTIEGPTGRFMLQQMASVAELEAGLISKRTKDALEAAKRRGVKLGGYWKEAHFTGAALKALKEAAERAAASQASDLAPVIAELQASGATSLRTIAAGLNERKIPTARGGKWSAVQVARVLARQAA